MLCCGLAIGELEVVCGPLPLGAPRIVEREEFVLLMKSARVGALDRCAGAGVERPATLFK
jgi:hypothetical protein